MAFAVTLHWPQTGLGHIVLDQVGRPTNTLTAAFWNEFQEAVRELEQCPNLQAVLISSAKPGQFLAGADLQEMVKRLDRTPSQIEADCLARQNILCRLSALPAVTLAWIDGACVGGGLELALACDFRWGKDSPLVTLGLPEVKLGLIPAWGGSTSLPRLIGLPNAGELILDGELIGAKQAQSCGLLDQVLPPTTTPETILPWLFSAEAKQASEKCKLKRKQAIPLADAEKEFLEFQWRQPLKSVLSRYHVARTTAIDHLLRTASMSEEASLADAAHTVSKIFGGESHRGLLNAFLLVDHNKKVSRQQAAAASGITELSKKQQIGVIGSGIMGRGIAAAALRHQWEVVVCDSSPEALAASESDILQQAAYDKQTGRSNPIKQAELKNQLHLKNHFAGNDHTGLVVEAIVETLSAKQELFGQLEKEVSTEVVLASNTSTIPISQIAKPLAHPERFLGMHFFNPVSRMRLVEIVRGEKTSEATISKAVHYARGMGKMPIVVGDGAGFLVNRLLFPYLNEAIELLQEGATIEQVDAAAVAFGMPLGPLALYDLVGLDTSVHAGMIMYRAFPDRAIASPLVPSLVKQGRLGQKSGDGFYLHTSSKGFTAPNPAAEKAILNYRKAERSIEQAELIDRLILPMLLEATRALAEGIASSPEDVDLGMIYGLGFPSDRGGLLFWADSLGAKACLEKLKPFASLGRRYEPTEMLVQMAETNAKFYS
ncbi:MAG: 3-hydroxyacyl-CoA dehydrogenase NAD-binding domain-containing protein [Planctomycetaceae bacterium]